MATKSAEHHAVPIIPINPPEFRETVKDSKNSGYIYLSIHRIMLDDYKKAVISDYHQKKVKGLLSLNLSHPTPAKLRDECLLVLHSRPKENDEKLIRDFFNLGVISNDYGPSIKRFDIDKLRPLLKFIKGQIEDTEPKNIELLAWLIDFEPRPYQYGVVYKDDEEPPTPGKDLNEIKQPDKQDQKAPETPPPTSGNTSKRVPLTRYGIDIIVLLITIIGGVGLSMRNANIEKNTTAYICTSKVAKRYHLNAKCRGLKNCKSQIIPTTIATAKEREKTLCEIER